jgi:hypothetical protein
LTMKHKMILLALLACMPLFAQYSFDLVCLDDTVQYIKDTTSIVQFYFRLENTGTLPDSYAIDCRVIDSVPGWQAMFCAGGGCGLPGVILYDYLLAGEVDSNIYIEVYPDSHYGTEFLQLYVNSVNNTGLYASINVYVIKATGIEENRKCISTNEIDIRLHPNPFSGLMNIQYDTDQSTESVELRIYDTTGRLIKEFSRFTAAALQPTLITWDGRDNAGKEVSNGIYFIQIEQNGSKKTAKIIRFK